MPVSSSGITGSAFPEWRFPSYRNRRFPWPDRRCKTVRNTHKILFVNFCHFIFLILISLWIIFFYCFLLALDYNYLYSITKNKKSLAIKAFHYWFIPSFLCFYEQRCTLVGSLLPYRFVVNSLLYDSYPIGGSIYFYFADASAHTSSDSVSTCGDKVLLY